jgi:hypothetical protein
MKFLDYHDVLTSFHLWVEDALLKKAEGYMQNIDNLFVSSASNSVHSTQRSFFGKYRQLVSDSSYGNTGVWVNGSFVPNGNSGVSIDFFNGRVIAPTSISSGAVISGKSAVRTVNVYDYYDEPETLVTHADFMDVNSGQWLWNRKDLIDNNYIFIPACLIMPQSRENKEFALGGEEKKIFNLEVAMIASDYGTIIGLETLFANLARSRVPLFKAEDSPYGHNWTLKTPTYIYDDFVASNSYGCAYIDSVKTSRLSGRVLKDNRLNYRWPTGFASFQLSIIDFPRS